MRPGPDVTARCVAALAAAALASCQSFEPAPPALLEAIAAHAAAHDPQSGVRAATAEFEGRGMRGTFEARLAVRVRGAERDVRLQLFPDVGGKFIDLVATPERVAGQFAQAGLTVDRRTGDAIQPSLLLMLGLALREAERPLGPQHAQELRKVDGATWATRPRAIEPGVHRHERIDADGRVLAVHLDVGPVTVVAHPHHTPAAARWGITSDYFTLHFVGTKVVPRELPDSTFELSVSSGRPQ